jgi:hypothetical protein
MNDRTQVANPFAVWTALAARASELMWPSRQAIGLGTTCAVMDYPEHRNSDNRGPTYKHRDNRWTEDTGRDNRGFTLIGRETLQAGPESFAAMMSYLATLNVQFAAAALRQWIELSSVMLSLGKTRVVVESVGQQAKPVTAIEPAQVSTQSGESTGRISRHGPKRTHSGGVKNGTRRRKK